MSLTDVGDTVAFLVALFVIYRYVWPILKKMMDERQELIGRQEQEAEDAAKALSEAKRKHETAVTEAEHEASRIRDDARSDATRIREELAEQTEQEVARIHQRGEEQRAAERDSAVRRLRSETGVLSMQLAQRIIEESMADESQKRASVDGFLDDLDGLGGSGSGTRQPAQAGGGVS